MRKAFKYRINPTSKQEKALIKSLNACRWVYNNVLATRKNAYEQDGISLSSRETQNLIPAWKKEHSFLKDAYSQCLQDANVRVDLVYQAFFRRVKQGVSSDEVGYPRFKGYHYYNSFTYTQSGFKFRSNDILYLAKIGDVKIKLHRPIEGKVKTASISRDKHGSWHISFSCEVESKMLEPTDKVVGVDLGLKTFATLSDGEAIERKRFLKTDEKEKTKAQRKLSKAPKGSKERSKHRKALNHVNTRIANRRKDFAHKEARKLVNNYQVIVFEDLDIKGMQDSNYKAMNRSISDVAWSQFVELTEQKAKMAGRTVVKVDPKNTTQMCSNCGEIVRKGLSERVHNCNHCGISLDRDLNAAKNILARGVACLETKESCISS